MSRHLTVEALETVIELLKQSDLSYREIATHVGCSSALVSNIANGDVPEWFVEHLHKSRGRLLNLAQCCPHCEGEITPWGVFRRADRVVEKLTRRLRQVETSVPESTPES